MKKKILSIVTVILLICVSLTVLVGCKPKFKATTLNDIGKSLPKGIVVPNKPTSTTDAVAMIETGMKNYYDVAYVASYQQGSVTTKVLDGLMTVTQEVASRKVKFGDNIYNDNYSATSSSGFINIRLMEETIVNTDGTLKFRAAKDKKNIEVSSDEGQYTCTEWVGTKDYASLADYTKEFPNDPTKIFMYIINSDTVSSASEITTTEDDSYKFTLELDVTKATTDYVKVMKYMLESSGMGAASIGFTKLSMEVEMWKEGLIKSIKMSETYDLNIGKIKLGVVTLVSSVRYTYDDTEMKMKDLLKAF